MYVKKTQLIIKHNLWSTTFILAWAKNSLGIPVGAALGLPLSVPLGIALSLHLHVPLIVFLVIALLASKITIEYYYL
jgi:hypothetical protein